MKPSRLPGRKNAAYLLRNGNVFRGHTMTIRWLPKAPYHPNIDPKDRAVYLGSFAPSKLNKSAVKRNRMRRRCREAVRTYLKERETFPTLQLLLSPRSSSLDCAYDDIRQDVERFFSTAS